MRDRIKRMEQIDIVNIVGFSGGNPKKRTDRDREILDASLDQHGYLLPVAVRELGDGTYELIDGHGRVDSIRTNNRATAVKALVLDVESVAEGRRVLLALKHTAEWDLGQLEDFVQATLDDGAGVEEIMASSGLTAADLDVLGNAGAVLLDDMAKQSESSNVTGGSVAPTSKVIEQDEIPALPKSPITKPGNVWHLGDSIVICGDCTQVTPDQVRIGELGFGFTSPPYNAGKNVERAVHGKEGGNSRYLDDDDQMEGDEYAHLLDAQLALMLGCCAIAVVNLQSLAANKRIIARWVARNAERLIDRGVWVKTTAQPAINRTVLNSKFEDLYIFDVNKKPKRTISTATFHGTVDNVFVGATAAKDNEYADVHGATMPVWLAQTMIEKLGTKADFVVDPFGGTGTTLIVAQQLGKRAALVERSPAYVDVIVERWESATGGKAQLA